MRTLTTPRTATTTTPAPPRVDRATSWSGREALDSPETAAVLNAAWSGDPLTLVPAPPGAGKTRLVTLLAAALSTSAGLRVGIAAQTRAQAIELATRLGRITPAVLGWSEGAAKPLIPGVKVGPAAFPTGGGGILIATTARWLHSKPWNVGADVMLVDEAWQATYADVAALGAFARQIVCVGDPGQIDPVVTGPVSRWAGKPAGPHVPAPDALLATYGDTATVVRLPHTWRLGPETTALIAPAFYPTLPFTSMRPPEHIETATGTLLPEWTGITVSGIATPVDPALITAAADRVRDLLTHRHVTASGVRDLTDADLAVVTPHVNQAAALRASLADLPGVLVGTANQLQGLERPAVVAIHPASGVRDLTEFTLDPGRACVMLSRHRSHLTVLMDAAVPGRLRADGLDLPGLQAHRSLLDALA